MTAECSAGVRGGCGVVLLLAGLSAHANDPGCGQLEFGLGWIDGRLDRGRYTAMQPDAGYGVLHAHVCRTTTPADDGASHWSVSGGDLGTRSRFAAMRAGVQGRWRFDLAHQRLPTLRQQASTPLQGIGGNALGLPDGWVAAPTTAAMSTLLPSLQSVELGTTRTRNRAGLIGVLPSSWQADAKFSQDRRHGLSPMAGLIGNTGGNPRVVMLPAPVDLQTRRIDVGLSHAGASQQVRFGYHASLFNNGVESMGWQNPFAAIAGWEGAAGFPSGAGQVQPPPDNQFHQLSLAIARDLARGMRINADVALGTMRQDQQYQPYTINPALQALAVEALPRTSLDGRIDTTLINLKLTSRPTRGWHWNASLRHDERDNRTPRDEYIYIGGDSQAQDASEASSRRRFNQPYDYRQQRASFDAGTRLPRRMRLDFGAAHEITTRNLQARERTEESRITAAFRGDPAAWVALGLRLAAADRDGSTYIGNRSFVAGHAPAYVATVPGAFENLPELRQFHLADRRRQQLAAFAQLMPAPEWNIGASFGGARDDYRRSQLGLTQTRLRDMLLDVSHGSATGWSFSGFVGREWLDARQDGRSFSGGPMRIPQSQDPERNWHAAHHDRIDTLGLGIGRQFKDQPLRWNLDYVLSDARGRVHVTTGPALPSAPLPDTRARLQRIDAGIDWRLGTASSLRVTVRQERFSAADWAVDGVGPATLANVILLGEESPDYRAHAVALSWRYAF